MTQPQMSKTPPRLVQLALYAGNVDHHMLCHEFHHPGELHYWHPGPHIHQGPNRSYAMGNAQEWSGPPALLARDANGWVHILVPVETVEGGVETQ